MQRSGGQARILKSGQDLVYVAWQEFALNAETETKMIQYILELDSSLDAIYSNKLL
jgi:hypothetical protein